MRRPDRSASCPVGPDPAPYCSTGPLGRFLWTLHEIADILHLPRRTRSAR